MNYYRLNYLTVYEAVNISSTLANYNSKVLFTCLCIKNNDPIIQ